MVGSYRETDSDRSSSVVQASLVLLPCHTSVALSVTSSLCILYAHKCVHSHMHYVQARHTGGRRGQEKYQTPVSPLDAYSLLTSLDVLMHALSLASR